MPLSRRAGSDCTWIAQSRTMSVLYQHDLDQRRDLPPDVRCALCGDPIAPPVVCWSGLDLLVWHPRCAAKLGAHLIADAREADLAAGDWKSTRLHSSHISS